MQYRGKEGSAPTSSPRIQGGERGYSKWIHERPKGVGILDAVRGNIGRIRSGHLQDKKVEWRGEWSGARLALLDRPGWRRRAGPGIGHDGQRSGSKGEKLNYHKEIASEYSIRRSIECRRVDEKASIGFPISPAARARDFCIGNFKNRGYPRILGRRSSSLGARVLVLVRA